MSPLDALAAVGEVLSWIGLGAGIPLLIVAGMIALAEGRWEPVDIAVIERDGEAIARWFAGGDFRERPLTQRENVTDGWHEGFVSVRSPGHVRMTAPMLRRLLATLGIVFAGVGIIGLVVSMIPAFT
ncbi:hypothetical protein ACSS7Z_11545 [Microbacterium sp. A82]|uniref:hypothetical protein n=1 Tax=Microbacterium sp. A82 TaxID=3450452 RepID=UPI003F2F8FD4